MPSYAHESFPSRQLINTLGFATCAGLLGFGYYLQFVQELEPCPLCIFQRVALFGLGIVFILAALHNPISWGSRLYGLLILVIAAAGAALASRQLWLQNLPPDQVPDCGPGLNYMLETFPLTDVISTVLQGSGDCAEVSWVFLGLSIPGWTLIAFVGLGLVGLIRNMIVTRAESL